jgi:hypothetical protein
MWRLWTIGRLAFAQDGYGYRETKFPNYVRDAAGKWTPIGLGFFLLVDPYDKITGIAESSINEPNRARA